MRLVLVLAAVVLAAVVLAAVVLAAAVLAAAVLPAVVLAAVVLAAVVLAAAVLAAAVLAAVVLAAMVLAAAVLAAEVLAAVVLASVMLVAVVWLLWCWLQWCWLQWKQCWLQRTCSAVCLSQCLSFTAPHCCPGHYESRDQKCRNITYVYIKYAGNKESLQECKIIPQCLRGLKLPESAAEYPHAHPSGLRSLPSARQARSISYPCTVVGHELCVWCSTKWQGVCCWESCCIRASWPLILEAENNIT